MSLLRPACRGEIADLLAGSIDMPGPPQHAGRSKDIWHCRQKARCEVGEAKSLDDLRQENADSIGAERESELNHGEHENPDIRKRGGEAPLPPRTLLRGQRFG